MDKRLWHKEFNVSFATKNPWLTSYFLESFKHAFLFSCQGHYFEKSGDDAVLFSVIDAFLLDFQGFLFSSFSSIWAWVFVISSFSETFFLFILSSILNRSHSKIFILFLLLIYVFCFLKAKLFLSQYFTIKCFNECFMNEHLWLEVSLCCQHYHSRTSNVSVLRKYKTNDLVETLWALGYNIDINAEGKCGKFNKNIHNKN